MTKRVLSLIICLSMLLSIFAMTVSATEPETPETPEVPTQAEFGIVGEWIWGETVAELGADEIVARCAENGVTDIYLLTKGTGGLLGYNKTQFITFTFEGLGIGDKSLFTKFFSCFVVIFFSCV